MRQWLRSHLTYANVMVTILAFLVLGGGTALAAYVVSSNSQIGPGTVSGHQPPTGKHANIIAGSINGQDIANRSGVDTCKTPLTGKYGPICVGSDGGTRDWNSALHYCSGFGLRLPSLAEAVTLAEKFDVPGVNSSQSFWTDENLYAPTGDFQAELENENGSLGVDAVATPHQTVCVTDPSA
jgi:hypothetical protein